MGFTTHKELLHRLAKVERERYSHYRVRAESAAEKAAYHEAMGLLWKNGIDPERIDPDVIPQEPVVTEKDADRVLLAAGIDPESL